MVSSGTVSSDMSTFDTNMVNYKTYVADLTGQWKGDSYNNLVTKANEFISEFQSAIDKQMTSFASACQSYEEYVNTKRALSDAQSAYNEASANKDRGSMSYYASLISQYEATLQRLKGEIEAALADASSPTLTASSASSDSLTTSGGVLNGSFTAGNPLGVDSGTYTNSFTSSMGKNMNYYAYVPNNAKEGMPLIVYLHGDNAVGNFGYLKNSEMAACVKKTYGDDFPFIFIQPNTEVTSWSSDGRLDTLAELIQNVATEYKCDPNKIILTGASRGGIGAWEMANAYPDMFSAFVPVSGHCNSLNLNGLSGISTMAFSSPSESDDWNYSNMKSNVKQINDAGGNATFVSMDNYNHGNIIKGVYVDETFDWMISQTKV